MKTMPEALARERMREQLQRSSEAALARELSAQRRWHRVSAFAQKLEKRHELRLRQAGTERVR